MTSASLAPPTAAVPAQRRDPNQTWPGQTKYAVDLMRRLWSHDPETCEELVAGLYEMDRVQLGRVVDNLMWTLANQPRPMNPAQWQHIQALWGRKMSKPMDQRARQRFAVMTEEGAQRFIQRTQAMPDRPRATAAA